MNDVVLLHQLNRWIQSAKEACDRKDHERAWSCCNQAQHNIISALRREEERSGDTKSVAGGGK